MTRQSGSGMTLGSMPVADQIQSLVGRGMRIPDQDFAIRCLNHIGYYRLATYWWPFVSGSSPTASFRSDTSFSQVMAIYMFDQRLRALLLEALSYIEISVRNQWSRQLVQTSMRGEYAHLDLGLFDSAHYNENLRELERNYIQARRLGGTDLWKRSHLGLSAHNVVRKSVEVVCKFG